MSGCLLSEKASRKAFIIFPARAMLKDYKGSAVLHLAVGIAVICLTSFAQIILCAFLSNALLITHGPWLAAKGILLHLGC